MRLFFSILLAGMSAFCIGYGISSGEHHVYFTALLYAILAGVVLACHYEHKKEKENAGNKQ